MVVCLKIPFYPNQPMFGCDEVYSFFFSFFYFLLFPFFSCLFLYALLLLNHNTSKSNFFVKLLSCKSNFFSQKFWGQLHLGTPQNGAPKNQFFERLKLECYFVFGISRYLINKYFDIVWGCHSPGDPLKWTPKNQFFE